MSRILYPAATPAGYPQGWKNGGFGETPSREIFEVVGNFGKFLKYNMYEFGKSEKVKSVKEHGKFTK